MLYNICNKIDVLILTTNNTSRTQEKQVNLASYINLASEIAIKAQKHNFPITGSKNHENKRTW